MCETSRYRAKRMLPKVRAFPHYPYIPPFANHIAAYCNVRPSCTARSTKRKFDADASAAESLAREAEEAALRQIERKQAEVPESKLSSPTPMHTGSGPSTSLTDVGLPPIVPGWSGFVESLAILDKCLPPRFPGWRGSVPSLACVLTFRLCIHLQGFR